MSNCSFEIREKRENQGIIGIVMASQIVRPFTEVLVYLSMPSPRFYNFLPSWLNKSRRAESIALYYYFLYQLKKITSQELYIAVMNISFSSVISLPALPLLCPQHYIYISINFFFSIFFSSLCSTKFLQILPTCRGDQTSAHTEITHAHTCEVACTVSAAQSQNHAMALNNSKNNHQTH